MLVQRFGKAGPFPIPGVGYEQVRSRLILRLPRMQHARCFLRARRPQRKHPVNSFRVNVAGERGANVKGSDFLVTDLDRSL
jgi:hypothetical protein